jgi:excisionase family DNA binding protein
MQPDVRQEYLTVREVAALLRASPRQVTRWLAAGLLRGKRRGGRGYWLVRPEAVEEFTRAEAAKPDAPSAAAQSREDAAAYASLRARGGYGI